MLTSAAHFLQTMGAKLESIWWTFQGKMNSWTFQGQLSLPLKQTLRRGREKKREQMRQEEKLCQQHTVVHVFSIQLSGLCHSYCDPQPNAPHKKKKKKPEKEKGEGRKRIQQCFFPACWKWAQSCQEEVCRPFPRAEEWRGSYATWGRYGGESERGGTLASGESWSGELWFSHTDGDWLVCLCHLQPHRALALISSVQNTRLHTARPFLPTCGLLLEQWFITNYQRRNYREMCINAT